MKTESRRSLLAKVHIAAKALGLDDDTYRDMLEALTGQRSAGKLSDKQLVLVVAALRAKGWNEEDPRPARPNRQKPAPRATPGCAPLLGKIEALLADAGRPWAYAVGMVQRMYKVELEAFPKGLFGGLDAYPVVNVSETEKEITVDAELPGLEVKDVDVSLQNGSLLITGEKKFEGEEKKDNYHRIERSYGKFTRAVPLPAKVNAKGIKARFEKGVLHVVLPKAEPSAPAQKIKIEG